MPKKLKFQASDSFTGQKLDHHMWCVSYEPAWQALRLDLSFKALVETQRSITLLQAYINTSSRPNFTKRIFRARNLINALPVGQANRIGIRHFDPTEVRQIVLYRNHIIDLYNQEALVNPILFWDWHDVRKALAAFVVSDVGTVITIYKKLYIRRGYRMRRAKKPELRYFLKLILEALDQ